MGAALAVAAPHCGLVLRSVTLLLDHVVASPAGLSPHATCPLTSRGHVARRHTGDTVVFDVQVGLEVLAARLRDGVDGGDEQRTVLTPGGCTAGVLHVGGHVGVAAERVRVLGGDAPTGSQPPVQRSTDDHHLARLTRRPEGLRRTEHLYTVQEHSHRPYRST